MNIFATKDDWIAVFATVESRVKVAYVAAGAFQEAALTVYGAGRSLPSLGQSPSPNAVSGPKYLVTMNADEVRMRPVTARDGVTRFYVDQMLNPGTIALSPGGIWGQQVLLSGRIVTISDSAQSQSLQRRYEAAVRRHFTKIRAYWVGDSARELLQAGWRLTAAVQAPRASDLAVPGEGP